MGRSGPGLSHRIDPLRLAPPALAATELKPPLTARDLRSEAALTSLLRLLLATEAEQAEPHWAAESLGRRVPHREWLRPDRLASA